jgi:hypothetical protein
VRIVDGAYLRIQGTETNKRLKMSHDDTNFNFDFSNTDEVNWDTTLSMSAPIKMAGNEIQFASLVDFSLKQQEVSGIATTEIDYESGSYITLTLTADIATLTLSNPPAVDVGVFRLKVVQDSTPRTIAWPASVQWPGGTAPTLSTASGAVDFIDIWTDDGGTTWYGAFNTDWS